jgi:signal transduction histidine kinase
MELEALVGGANAHTKTAATYFGIDLSDADQALPVAQYEAPETVKNRAEEKLADEVRNMALVSAAGQSFSSIHGGADLLVSIARTARVLFNFEETVILLQHADSGVLRGFPIGEHQQRLSELSIPLADSGTIAESVSKKRVSFAGGNTSSPGIVDEQLLRAMGTECLTYIPLIAGQSCLGVLVGGLSSLQHEELWGQERFLKSFAAQAATSLQSSAAARNEIEEYISNANEAHRETSLRVIHEVNNPLSIIKNYLGVLDDKLTNQQQVTEELSIINSEIDRVSRIVGELAQPQSTQQQEEITELNNVLKDVVRLFSISRFLPGSVSIVVRATEQAAEVIGSADPIKQILLNLIKNAVEALPMGGEIEVRNNGLKLWEGRAYIELCVSDTGKGIPADILANLFSPVRSSKNGERRGLGLNIVQNLVKKLNGYISCRSGESGTIFEVLLPAYKVRGYADTESKHTANMK